jgi:hypothetical protein
MLTRGRPNKPPLTSKFLIVKKEIEPMKKPRDLLKDTTRPMTEFIESGTLLNKKSIKRYLILKDYKKLKDKSKVAIKYLLKCHAVLMSIGTSLLGNVLQMIAQQVKFMILSLDIVTAKLEKNGFLLVLKLNVKPSVQLDKLG